MRVGLALLAGAWVAAAGCGGSGTPAPLTEAEEKAAEKQLQDEAAREGKMSRGAKPADD
jgi:hypothetical protein